MNIAIILAGGTGTRLGGDIPKQYLEAGGKLIIQYCLETCFGSEEIDAVQIVAEQRWRELIEAHLPEENRQKWKGFSEPGQTRQLSIWNALMDIAGYAGRDDMVFIHDAARPLLSHGLLHRCLQSAQGHDGALPVLPMKDTVYYSEDGKNVSGLLKRSSVYAGQAPEVFVYGKYYEANRALFPERIKEINGSTEPAVTAGMDIVMIDGEEDNFKITTQADLDKFQRMIGLTGKRYKNEGICVTWD